MEDVLDEWLRKLGDTELRAILRDHRDLIAAAGPHLTALSGETPGPHVARVANRAGIVVLTAGPDEGG